MRAEKQKAAKQASERLARELNMASDLPAWEKDILPNWRAVLDDEVAMLWRDCTDAAATAQDMVVRYDACAIPGEPLGVVHR